MPLAKRKRAWDGEVMLDSQWNSSGSCLYPGGGGGNSPSPTPDLRAGCLAFLQKMASLHLPAPHRNWEPPSQGQYASHHSYGFKKKKKSLLSPHNRPILSISHIVSFQHPSYTLEGDSLYSQPHLKHLWCGVAQLVVLA